MCCLSPPCRSHHQLPCSLARLFSLRPRRSGRKARSFLVGQSRQRGPCEKLMRGNGKKKRGYVVGRRGRTGSFVAVDNGTFLRSSSQLSPQPMDSDLNMLRIAPLGCYILNFKVTCVCINPGNLLSSSSFFQRSSNKEQEDAQHLEKVYIGRWRFDSMRVRLSVFPTPFGLVNCILTSAG